MPAISRLDAVEILDSRGRPTVQAMCVLADGTSSNVSVPSGASTGAAEAHELRDGELSRYRGLGCRRAVANIRGEIQDAVRGMDFGTQAALDGFLIELDGTGNKARLGANALLAVSLAFARAMASHRHIPLYQHFADILAGEPDDGHAPLRTLPRPTINLFSGGKHAGAQIPIQDVLVVPASARTIDEAMAMTCAVFQAAADLIADKYHMRVLTADEGGLAPPFTGADAMLQDAVTSIESAGYMPGVDVALAVDVASSHFYVDGRYHLDGKELDSDAMRDVLIGWLDRYPIVSIEDGLAEDDWANWPSLYEGVDQRALVLGDDFLCTNPARIQRAIDARAADALLLKVNQIGSLSEAADAYRLARSAGWAITISARSGETEDNWLGDLSVGWSGDQIKVGSITQSDRLAKYNRLLTIEAETGLPMVAWPNLA
ncbi:MAG: phosphopyruvate hydratase [Caldilineaceae bacterium]